MTIQLQSTSDPASGSFSVNELSLLTELPLRTVRYYITQGLVELLQGGPVVIPERPKQVGAITVKSHIWLGPGLELQVSAEDAGLSPEQLRQLVTAVTRAITAIQGKQP